MRIGITGGIASGKSLISSIIQEKGYRVIDADKIAHKLMEVGGGSYQAIVKEFGEEILDEEDKLDRKKLGQIIFSQPDKRLLLNQISHPLIKDEFIWELATISLDEIVFLDIPLLFESDFRDLVDYVILVYLRPDLQEARLMKRDQIDKDLAQAKIASQMPLVDKVPLADYIIDNSGSRESSRLQLEYFLEKLDGDLI